MTDYNSRSADKFVVRLPQGVRNKVFDHSAAGGLSMNNWIVVAIEEKLVRAERQELLLDALEVAASTRMEMVPFGIVNGKTVYGFQEPDPQPAPDLEPLPFWEPCNPGCDPELNGQRSKGCAQLCEGARAALQGGDS